MNLELRPYQIVARDHLRNHPRAALWLDMGLGKTASTLSALTVDHLPALVVAPKRVAEEVWPVECEKWRPDLTYAAAVGSPKQREAAIESRADVTVIGRDVLSDVLDHAKLGRWKTFIIDESSGVKNRSTKRWRACRRIIADTKCPHVWELTGTPSPNGYMDLWAQVYLLDGGARLGSTLTAFRNRYFTPGRTLPTGVVVDYRLRPGAGERINKLLADICLSMGTEGRVKLPPVTFNDVVVSLPPGVRRTYERLEKDFVVNIQDVMGVESVHSATNAAVLTNRLSQIAAGWLYPDTEDAEADPTLKPVKLHEVKLEALDEIREGTSGSPILVFYRYRQELNAILERYPDARPVTSKNVIADWNAGKVPMMVAHPASAGHGLNLQFGGHNIVWTSPTWSLEEWEQGNKRLARSGQKNPVVIHSILADGTVDRMVADRVEGKQTVQDALLAYLESKEKAV